MEMEREETDQAFPAKWIRLSQTEHHPSTEKGGLRWSEVTRIVMNWH